MSLRRRQNHWQPGQYFPEVAKELHELYTTLREHFGYAKQWWPGTSWETTLTALLVQQCNWTTAYQALGRLQKNGLLGLPELSAAASEKVRHIIHPVSFAPTKALRLIGLAQSILDRRFSEIEPYLHSADTAALRHDLLSFPGIGEETADCILLYAGDQHPCFIVDSYARRTFQRVRLFCFLDDRFWDRPYAFLRQFFQTHLLSSLSLYDDFSFDPGVSREIALLRDFHAQIVELGRHHCLKSRPRCQACGNSGRRDDLFYQNHCTENGCTGCPLVDLCAWHHKNQSAQK